MNPLIADSGLPVLFRNEVTHWWDASEVYGTDDVKTKKLRGNHRRESRDRSSS